MPVPAQGALGHVVTPLYFWKQSRVLVPFCTQGTDLTDNTSFYLQPAGLETLRIKFFVGNHLLMESCELCSTHRMYLPARQGLPESFVHFLQ